MREEWKSKNDIMLKYLLNGFNTLRNKDHYPPLLLPAMMQAGSQVVEFYLQLSVELDMKIPKATLKESIEYGHTHYAHYVEIKEPYKLEMKKIIEMIGGYYKQLYGVDVEDDNDDNNDTNNDEKLDLNHKPICVGCLNTLEKVEFENCYDNKGKEFSDMRKIRCRGCSRKKNVQYADKFVQCIGNTDEEKKKTLLWHCTNEKHRIMNGSRYDLCIDCATNQVRCFNLSIHSHKIAYTFE